MNQMLNILKENPARLLNDRFPEIMIDSQELSQEAVFDVYYKNRLIGTAQLQYRIPYISDNLRESQTFLVYNRPAHWLHGILSRQLGEGKYNSKTRLVYCLFKWKQQDLFAFEAIAKEVWEGILEFNKSQLHIDYSR